MGDLEPNFDYSDSGYPVKEPVSYFAISLRQPNKIRLINVGPELVRCIQERLEQLITVETFGYVIFKDYMQTSFTGRFNIYDIIVEKHYFEKPEEGGSASVSREDSTLIHVAFCRILGTLFCYGYDVVVSSDLARDAHAHTTIFFRLRDPTQDYLPLHYYSHKFICVTPYGNDSILLINIPKVAVEPILKIIHLTWSPGIKSKQTLADDDRSVSVVISLKLSGSPWNQAVFNSGKATIQARLIILELTRILASHKWRFAINVNFSGTTDSFFYQWCPNLELDEYRYCAIILSRYDRLRMLHVPTNLVPVIRECANKFWYLQVDKQKEYHGTTELKLGGCPWWADGNDAVEARYFISSMIGSLKANGWEVCGTIDLSRHNNDKSTFLLRQCAAQFQPHMCISFNRANRIRLIVGSSDISEEAELQLTTRMNDVIKQRWVALGPRNYGKSVEWKLEGDPWDTEGLYSDQTRGVYLLCLILEAIQPLGWKLVSSADVSAKNLDANERGYALVGKPEDMHSWFFLYDVTMRRVTFPLGEADIGAAQQLMSMAHQQHNNNNNNIKNEMMTGSSSVPNLDASETLSPQRPTMMYHHYPQPMQQQQQQQQLQHHHHHYGCASRQQQMPPQQQQPEEMMYPGGTLQSHRSRSVPSVAAAVAAAAAGGGMQHNMADPYSSRNSLYGPEAHHMMTGRNDYPCDSGFYGGAGVDRTFSTFRGGGGGYGVKPCYANGRCQSRQKAALVRQASAGSLPADHHANMGYCGARGSSAYNLQHTSDDMGYKSDGEGYKSDGGGYFRGCSSVGPNSMYRSQPYSLPNHQRQPQQQQHHETMYNSSSAKARPHNNNNNNGNGYVSDGEGYLLNQQNRRVTRSGKYGGSHTSSPGGGDGGNHLRGGGDDDDQDPNQTPDDDDDDDVDDDDDDGQDNEDTQIEAGAQPQHRNNGGGVGTGMIVTTRRASSASAKAAALASAVTSLATATGKMLSDPDVIVSYSTFQAEAAINRSGSRGNVMTSSRPGAGSCEELYTVEVTEAAVRRSNSGGCVIDGANGGAATGSTSGRGGNSQRNSRSSSRQDFHSGSDTGGPTASAYPCNTCRGSSQGIGRASSRQSDRQSDGGYRSDGVVAGGGGGGGRGSAASGGAPGSRCGIDGYRSEGSTDSPMRTTNQGLPGMAGSVAGVSGAGGGSGGSSGSIARKQHHRQLTPMSMQNSQHYHPHQQQPPPLPPHHNTAGVLKQRNGQLELVHPSTLQQQQQQQQQQHQQQQQQCSTSRSMHSFQRQESSASFQSGHSMRSTHSAPTCPSRHYHPHVQMPGQQPQQPQQQQHRGYSQHGGGANVESCSTQSSSSSASAPPDYATCSGIPPSYDQALNTFGSKDEDGGHHHRRKQHRDQSNHQRGHSASRQQQQPRPAPSSTSVAGSKRPGSSSANKPTVPQQQPQDVRSNDFYYVGEFYG